MPIQQLLEGVVDRKHIMDADSEYDPHLGELRKGKRTGFSDAFSNDLLYKLLIQVNRLQGSPAKSEIDQLKSTPTKKSFWERWKIWRQ